MAGKFRYQDRSRVRSIRKAFDKDFKEAHDAIADVNTRALLSFLQKSFKTTATRMHQRLRQNRSRKKATRQVTVS